MLQTVKTLLKRLKTNYKKEEKTFAKSNLTQNEIKALKDLGLRDDIIITKADKGKVLAIISMNRIDNLTIKTITRKLQMTQPN